jgi:hypothetical protein
MEHLLEQERVELEKERQRLYAERLAFRKTKLAAQVPVGFNQTLDSVRGSASIVDAPAAEDARVVSPLRDQSVMMPI